MKIKYVCQVLVLYLQCINHPLPRNTPAKVFVTRKDPMLVASAPSLDKRSQIGKACVWCPLIQSLHWCLLSPPCFCSLLHTLSPGRRTWTPVFSCIKIFLHATIFSPLGHSHMKRIEDEGKPAKETEWVLDTAGEKPRECYPRGHVEWRKMEEMTNWVKYADRSAKIRTENRPSDLIDGSHCLLDRSDFCCNGSGEILSSIWNWIHQSWMTLEMLRTGIFPVISINKDGTVIRIPGHSGRRRVPAIRSHQAAATPYREPRGTWCEKHRIPAPESWDAYERSDFGESKLLHLPIHGKALNSLRYLISWSLKK